MTVKVTLDQRTSSGQKINELPHPLPHGERQTESECERRKKEQKKQRGRKCDFQSVRLRELCMTKIDSQTISRVALAGARLDRRTAAPALVPITLPSDAQINLLCKVKEAQSSLIRA